MSACPAPRGASWIDHLSIDLDDCQLLEISVGLVEEYETAGHRFETWPAPVRVVIERELARWTERNPDRVIRAFTTAATKGACFLALHHAKK